MARDLKASVRDGRNQIIPDCLFLHSVSLMDGWEGQMASARLRKNCGHSSVLGPQAISCSIARQNDTRRATRYETQP